MSEVNTKKNSSGVSDELRKIYTDPNVWMFIATGLSAIFATGSYIYGVTIIGLLSLVYLSGGNHR